ncbi:hypothetical protein TNCV_3295021 [Trichonephila clavipes]|uniref:Uncharacterized protein n=1 Tax=Trichonephila clavipes TaxID=2585209 RepID=A0A8X6T900_TRICX|nr:hypothetical protein TNCV_3295021 [Trichonephila clavipes]
MLVRKVPFNSARKWVSGRTMWVMPWLLINSFSMVLIFICACVYSIGLHLTCSDTNEEKNSCSAISTAYKSTIVAEVRLFTWHFAAILELSATDIVILLLGQVTSLPESGIPAHLSSGTPLSKLPHHANVRILSLDILNASVLLHDGSLVTPGIQPTTQQRRK